MNATAARGAASARPMALDPYIVRTLMPDLVGHDRQPSSFLLYLYLWHQTSGGRRASASLSLRTLAEDTGISKRAVQTSLGNLVRRRLLTITRATATAVPTFTVHRPWRRRARAGGRRA